MVTYHVILAQYHNQALATDILIDPVLRYHSQGTEQFHHKDLTQAYKSKVSWLLLSPYHILS